MQVTLELPDEVFTQLQPFEDRLPQILALSCSLCNKHKGSDLASYDPETGEIVPLYLPRLNEWNEHFCLSEAEFVPLTAIGRVLFRLLQFNRKDRVEERQLLLEAGMIERTAKRIRFGSLSQ